jgi:hypothetical protein
LPPSGTALVDPPVALADGTGVPEPPPEPADEPPAALLPPVFAACEPPVFAACEPPALAACEPPVLVACEPPVLVAPLPRGDSPQPATRTLSAIAPRQSRFASGRFF